MDIFQYSETNSFNFRIEGLTPIKHYVYYLVDMKGCFRDPAKKKILCIICTITRALYVLGRAVFNYGFFLAVSAHETC